MSEISHHQLRYKIPSERTIFVELGGTPKPYRAKELRVQL